MGQKGNPNGEANTERLQNDLVIQMGMRKPTQRKNWPWTGKFWSSQVAVLEGKWGKRV